VGSKNRTGRLQVPPTPQGGQQTPLSSTVALRRCSESVTGLWAKGTHRRFRRSGWRFEVIFETPVIFVASPLNPRGPIFDQEIHYIDGTDIDTKVLEAMLKQYHDHILPTTSELRGLPFCPSYSVRRGSLGSGMKILGTRRPHGHQSKLPNMDSQLVYKARRGPGICCHLP
jgi:hypothetical protein